MAKHHHLYYIMKVLGCVIGAEMIDVQYEVLTLEDMEKMRDEGSEFFRELAGVANEIWNEEYHEHWTIEGRAFNFGVHMHKPHAIMVVARVGGRIVGYSWGSEAFEEELVKKFAHGAEGLRVFYENGARVWCAYGGGLIPGYRRQKIGTELYRSRAAEVYGMGGFSTLLGRTRQPGARRIFEELGYYNTEIPDGEDSRSEFWALDLRKDQQELTAILQS